MRPEIKALVENYIRPFIAKMEVKMNSRLVQFATGAAEEHLRLIRDAMDHGGANPETGAYRAWPDLSEWRSRQLNGQRVSRLHDTGLLRGSLYFRPTAVMAGGELRATGGYEIGSAAPYATLHQEGGVNEQGFKVPARPFLILAKPWVRSVFSSGFNRWVRDIQAALSS